MQVRQTECEQLEDLLAQAEARCERSALQLAQAQAEAADAMRARTSCEAALTAQLQQQVSIRQVEASVDLCELVNSVAYQEPLDAL
jgi:hypothetical protein